VLEVVRRSGLAERLGREQLLFNVRVGIERYLALPPAGDASTAGGEGQA
jgi:hypothetical protein